ncbi:MAG: TIGR00341 family protein [Thiogranum sp.]
MKLIEVVTDPTDLDALVSFVAESQGALDYWFGQAVEGERQSFRMLVADENRQAVLDSLQELLGGTENTRIVVLPVEGVLPRPDAPAQSGENKASGSTKTTGATREELYHQISRGARLDSTFLVLVALSTIVAAIGLLEDNVAVLVGAMVIAPLLGPNLALAFAATLGDRDLMRDALRTDLVGLGLALLLSVAIGRIWPVIDPGAEIITRTDVGFDGVALALASGAAAALSLASGAATALVGVMVAVALLPPTATLGMMLAGGRMELASGAALLLAVNIVSVNLSATLAFLAKGVRPRTWLEKRQARQSAAWVAVFWTAALLILSLALYFRQWISS